MIVKINKSIASGVIQAPPSKSYAHRLLIGAALSGDSTISNVAFSDDILATLDCLKTLGCTVNINNDKVHVSLGDNRGDTFNCRESGSTLRFLIPIVLAKQENASFVGTEKLFSRGISVYEKIFKEQKIQ